MLNLMLGSGSARSGLAPAFRSAVRVCFKHNCACGSDTTLDLRVEAYNVLNHPNPADPIRFLDSPMFGVPVSMLNLMLGSGSARSGLTPAFQIGGPRLLQAQLRLRF